MSEKQIVKVHDKDGVYRSMVVDRTTSAKDVVALFVKKLNAASGGDVGADQYRLYIDSPDGKRVKCVDEDVPHKFLQEHADSCKAKGSNPQDKPLKFTILLNTVDEPAENGNNGPPPQVAEEGIYLKKKKKGPVKAFFESYWVVYREVPARTLELYESEEQTHSVVLLPLENALFELQASEGELYLVITLGNSEKHIFHSDEDGVIQQWMEALRPVNALTPSLSSGNLASNPQTAIKGPFVPSTQDLAQQMKKKPQGPKENIEMQIKVLVNWVDYLITKQNLSVLNLDKDLRDGVVLIKLLEILLARKITFKQPKSVFDYVETVNTFLGALPSLGLSAGSVTAHDIAENSTPRLLLPLLWSMFFKFIETDKDGLLAWGKNYSKTKGINLNGFASLQDGITLAAIISEFRSDFLDFEAVQKSEPLAAITTVMETATKSLNTPKLFEPSEAEHADEKIWALYLSFFYLALDPANQEKWNSFQERREAPPTTPRSSGPAVAKQPAKPPPPAVNSSAVNPATVLRPTSVYTKKAPPVKETTFAEKAAKEKAAAPASVATPAAAAATPAAAPVATQASAPVPSPRASTGPAPVAAPASTPAPTPSPRASTGPIAPSASASATNSSPSSSSNSSSGPSPSPSPRSSTTSPATTVATPSAGTPPGSPAITPATTTPSPTSTTPTETQAPTPTKESTESPSSSMDSTAAATSEKAVDEVPRPPESPSTGEVVLDEKFVGGAIDQRLLWYNPPQNWGLADSGLVIYPDKNTDFWRKTHYGFERDNGHYLYMPTAGDFTATTYLTWKSLHEYDQGGLMIRLNESCWLKTSIEHQVEGPAKLGVVVTNYGYSDWSTQNWYGGNSLTLRVRRVGADYFVDYWSPKQPAGWTQLRIAHLFDDDGTSDVLVGLYACSPTDAGYEVVFENLKIEANTKKP